MVWYERRSKYSNNSIDLILRVLLAILRPFYGSDAINNTVPKTTLCRTCSRSSTLHYHAIYHVLIWFLLLNKIFQWLFADLIDPVRNHIFFIVLPLQYFLDVCYHLLLRLILLKCLLIYIIFSHSISSLPFPEYPLFLIPTFELYIL